MNDLSNDKAKHDEEGSPQKTLGEIFKNARTAQGKSLYEIAEKTCINQKILQAIEDNNRELLPADVFVRGLLRIYADCLNIDKQKVIKLFEDEWGNNEHNTNLPEYIDSSFFSPVLNLKKIIIILLILAAALGYYFSSNTIKISTSDDKNTDTPQSKKIEIITKETQKDSSPLNEDSKNTGEQELPTENNNTSAGTIDSKELNAQENSSLENIATQNIPQQQSEDNPSSIQTLSTEQENEDVKENYLVEAEFKERTWVRVNVDSSEPREHIFMPGDQQTWQASKGIDLYIGNAGGVFLTVNGKQFPINKESGQTVRLKIP